MVLKKIEKGDFVSDDLEDDDDDTEVETEV